MSEFSVYVIETKDDKVLIQVKKNPDKTKERMYAFAKYFLTIAEQEVSLDKVGSIIQLHEPWQKDQNQWYAFRVAPLLWKMNIIGTRHAVDNLMNVVGYSTRKEAKSALKSCADADAKLLPLIDELKLEAEKKNE